MKLSYANNKICINKSNIKNNINVELPISKSYAIRACAAAFLANDTNTINKIKSNADNDDIKAGLNCIDGISKKSISNCSESALAIRLFSFIASCCASADNPITLVAEGSLRYRELEKLSEVLTYFKINNFLEELKENNTQRIDLIISSKINSGNYILFNVNTSQILTGALMTLPLCEEDSTIKIKNLKSKYYIELTLEIMKKFGVYVENKNYEDFYIKGGQKYTPKKIELERDWSAAANFFILGAIRGDVSIKDLDVNSKQPDKIIYDFLKKLKIDIVHNKNKIEIKKSNITEFNFDATDYPDLIPPLVVLALNSTGCCYITGIHRLLNKESNRRDALLEEFTKLGANIKFDLQNDRFIINPGELSSGSVNSHNDHRIAMALGIAAVSSGKNINIINANSVSKSFPDFWKTILKT